ncbi:MAG TPA: SDR family oxidoreductase [Candidatus Limnocylindrales bacterium]|nr:SDR family oxidoreductase [Candidatus Limnocylindrales bacterium]
MHTSTLEGQQALVTGGSRGIGRAIVQRLRAEGAAVVFGYLGSREAAAEVEQTTGAVAVQADLATAGGVARFLSQARERLSGLDILVNNAAATVKPSYLAEMTDDDFDHVMAVNMRAVFLTMRHAAQVMRDGGRIINISTLNTRSPGPGVFAYAASKGAIEQFTAVAAMELGGRGITVNSVLPGATDTDLLRFTNTGDILEVAARMTPLGRVGQPSDIAAVVAFLAGPDGAWVTGQHIAATGGLR